jgi:hypothetical protein
MTELMNDEIKQAIAKIGEELGAEMIVHNCISVGAKKEIGGEMYGDWTLLFDSAIEDGHWRYDLNRFVKRAKVNFGIEQDEEQNKGGA